jgi:hypothetical protein
MDGVNTHVLKSWPEFFGEIIAGRKTHDLRRSDDRNFAVGDHLHLREWDPKARQYTGHETNVIITYITDEQSPCAYSTEALGPGFCILSIRLLKVVV